MARESKKSGGGIRWRLWFGLAGGALVCVSTAMAALKVSHFVRTDPQFTLSRDRKGALAVEGLQYAARSKVTRIFAGDFGRSVFSIPLAERRRRLLGIDWVADASVSRIWPDRLLVRIRERAPVAFVVFRWGAMLIDSEGVLLEPPAQAQFTFPVLGGVREDDTDAARAERVRALLGFQRDMGRLAKDVSEVNAADPENLRIVVRLDDRALELVMGGEGFAQRYQNFLSHFQEIRKRSPEARLFDLRVADRITAKE